jgi:hypothetical protein
VHEHPVTLEQVLLGEQPHADHALHAVHGHLRQVLLGVGDRHDLARYP